MVGDYDAGFRRGPAGYDRAYRGGRPGYGRDLVGYGVDYEPSGATLAPPGWPHFGGGPRRRRVVRADWRTRGGPAGAGAEAGWGEAGGWGRGRGRAGWSGGLFRGYERRQPYPRGERHYRNVPPDYRRYLSEDEYGLGPRRGYDRAFLEDRFRRGPLGPRNALFGGEGFARYDADFEEQWW